MDKKSFLGSLLLILSYSFAVATTSSEYKMSDLLRNQLDLQISLVIPEYYTKAFAQNPSTALDQAVEFLADEQVPFRLYFNRTKAKPSPVVSPAIRYVKYQRVWLVIVVVLRKSEEVNLFQAVRACEVRGALPLLHKDLIQLVVDESANMWDAVWNLNLQRQHVPLYLLSFVWSGNSFISPNAMLLRETCRCDDGSAFVSVGDYFTMLARPSGLEKLQAKASETKKRE